MTGHFFTGEGWGGGEAGGRGAVGRGGGGEGAVDERYVTLGGVYRPALRSVTRGWGGVKFPGKKRYVTLEWPLIHERT